MVYLFITGGTRFVNRGPDGDHMRHGYLIHQLYNIGVITDEYTICTRFQVRLNEYPELLQRITTVTKFLEYGASIRERIHCILQGITTQPKCCICGKTLHMRLQGRFKNTFSTYCSRQCMASSEQVKHKRRLRHVNIVT